MACQRVHHCLTHARDAHRPRLRRETRCQGCRWDQGDLIIGKYLYPATYGLVPFVLSRFRHWKSRNVYSRCPVAQRRLIYTSTFNIRALLLKLMILALMAVVRLAQADRVEGLFSLLALQVRQHAPVIRHYWVRSGQPEQAARATGALASRDAVCHRCCFGLTAPPQPRTMR